jgi:hypothetical protein
MKNRNITWVITYQIDKDVTQPVRLNLQQTYLDHGKWTDNPPSQIKSDPGNFTRIRIRASGASFSFTGAEGVFTYTADNAAGTSFVFRFDIPYKRANSGSLIGGSDHFKIEGGKVPASGNSVTVPVTIRQIGPV